MLTEFPQNFHVTPRALCVRDVLARPSPLPLLCEWFKVSPLWALIGRCAHSSALKSLAHSFGGQSEQRARGCACLHRFSQVYNCIKLQDTETLNTTWSPDLLNLDKFYFNLLSCGDLKRGNYRSGLITSVLCGEIPRK